MICKEGIVFGQLLYEDSSILYEGEMYQGKPYGKGIVYFPDGVKYQEGIFGIKGLNAGQEYYPNGQVRFDGVYRVNRAYGPNAPWKGKTYDSQGVLLFDGEFRLTAGGVGYPSVVEPKEYGPVVQKDAPRYHWIMYNDVELWLRWIIFTWPMMLKEETRLIDRDFEAKCLAAFMKNPFYKEEYENAPSEGCKRYLRMNFCYSKAPEVKDYAKEMVKIKETLGKEDFEHLIKYCGNNRMRYEYRKLIKRLEGDFEED